MTEPTPPTPEAKRPRGRFQLGLRALFWVVAALAVWMTVEINRRENARLGAKVAALKLVARELVVGDPGRMAAVKLYDLWHDEMRWDVYLPPGRYRVALATRGIDWEGFSASAASAAIEGGKHRLTLEESERKTARFVVKRDDRDLFAADEPPDWKASGWSSTGVFSESEQPQAGRPLELIRRRNALPEDNKPGAMGLRGPRNGLHLWIERIKPGPSPSK